MESIIRFNMSDRSTNHLYELSDCSWEGIAGDEKDVASNVNWGIFLLAF
jgi:hypothetical protein